MVCGPRGRIALLIGQGVVIAKEVLLEAFRLNDIRLDLLPFGLCPGSETIFHAGSLYCRCRPHAPGVGWAQTDRLPGVRLNLENAWPEARTVVSSSAGKPNDERLLVIPVPNPRPWDRWLDQEQHQERDQQSREGEGREA